VGRSALREETQGKAGRLFADVVAIRAAMAATDDILSSMMDSPSPRASHIDIDR